MTRIVLLEAAAHRHLRLDPMPRGGGGMLVPVGRHEVPLAAVDAPLFLAKDGGSGAFEIVALVGLVAPRNLFWGGQGWHATYLPEAVLAAPFRLSPDGPTGLSIDRDDARLGATGAALFDAAGVPTPVVERERTRLCELLDAIDAGRATAARFVALGVVRPLVVTLAFADGTSHALEGLYGFDHDALAALPDAAVVAAYRSGDLALASIIVMSLGQVERLRQLHDAGGGPAIADVTVDLA